MERHNQKADQMPLGADLTSLVLEDAVPFSSNLQGHQGTGIIPAQQIPSLVTRAAVAMPSRMQPQTGMSSSFPSQSGLSERLPEVRRASPVYQRAVDEPVSLQQDLLKQVDPKALKTITGSSPPPLSSSRPPMSGSFSDLSSLKKSAFLANIPDISDEDIEHYRDQFPGHLKSDVLDAMIIYQEDDLDDVSQFLSRVDSDVRLNNVEKPKVVLYTEVRPDINTPVGQLDMSLPLCTYIFLYVTKKFCADGWTEFSSQTCLMEAIYNPEKKWSVVPIFTESRRHATYKIPASIRSLKGIQYWSEDKFYADSLRKLLEDKLHIRKSKEVELKHKRKLWIIQKKAEEIREADRREQEKQHALAEERLRQARYEQERQEKDMRHIRKIHLPDPSELKPLYHFDPKTEEESIKYFNYLSHCFPDIPHSHTVPSNLNRYVGTRGDFPPAFHSSMSVPQTSAMHSPPFTYFQEGILPFSNYQTSTLGAHSLDSELVPSPGYSISKTSAEPQAVFSLPSLLSSGYSSSGPSPSPAPVSFAEHPSADLSRTSATLSSGSGSSLGDHPHPHLDHANSETSHAASCGEYQKVRQRNERDGCRYFDLAVPDPCKIEAGSENVSVPQRSGGDTQDPLLPVDGSQQQQGASSFPTGLERLSESHDIEEDLPPASRTFSTSNQAEAQRFQQSSFCRTEVGDRRVPVTSVDSVLKGQGTDQEPVFSRVPSQFPTNRIASPMHPFIQHGMHAASHQTSYVRPQPDHIPDHRYPPFVRYPPGIGYPTACTPMPESYNPTFYLGQQPLFAHAPTREVHHYYYPDPSYTHLPPTINIKNAENVTVGNKIHVTHKGKEHERHKEAQQSQQSPMEQSSAREIVDPLEQMLTEPGQREPPELEPRGPSLRGNSLDSLNPSSSGLTGQVTADQSRAQSPMASPDLPREPSRNDPRYGFADLRRTHSNTGDGTSRYPLPSPDGSLPGMAVKPVAVTRPFNPTAEEQQWRKRYDAEHETAVKRLSDCGEESREQLSNDDDDENHSSNAETGAKLRTA